MKIQKKQEIEFFGTKTGNANSIALGYATETKNFGEVAVGVMNKSTAAKDPNSSKGVCVDPDATLFSVGCGGSGERKNALEVKGDGSVIIPGENGDINIADKIKQAFDTDASIKLVKSAENSLQYTLMVNNESRGSINIPKDQFLKNVTYDSEGKQLVFTFVTIDEDEHVEKVPVGDLKDIYTAGEGINIDNNVISADFSSVMTAISDEKTQRETTDNEIKSTLDTKANKTDVNNRLNDLQNYCFKLGPDGRISTPFNDNIKSFDRKIQQLNNNEEYTYADISQSLNTDEQEYIYDKTINKFIKITKVEESVDTNSGDLFRTAEPLNLTHTFYLDNEKTGNVENLDRLAIEESNVFVNLPYLDTNDILDDDTAPQYIYDATDNKWIEVVETYYLSDYYAFNTEEPLNLKHELYYSNDSSLLIKWTLVEPYSIALGINASANNINSIALGNESTVTNCDSVALGVRSVVNGAYSIALGNSSSAKGNQSVALGHSASANTDYSIALGFNTKVNGNRSISLGTNTINNDNCIALGLNALTRASYAVALGNDTVSYTHSVALGYNADASYESTALGCNTSTGNNSIALGYNANAGYASGYAHVNSIAIGVNSKALQSNSIIIGTYTTNNGTDSIIIGNNCKTDFNDNILIGKFITSKASDSVIIGYNKTLSKSACYSLSSSGKALMEMDRDNYGLYLRGFGGYDGTNLVVKSGNTETLNPNIKSVQEVINEKADASAIPTKVSQLTNDLNFPTPNDNVTFAGLTIHNNAQIRYIQKYHHEDKYTYLIAETPADRVANKVFAADGSLFDVGKLVKNVQCNVSGDSNNIEFGYTTVDGTYNFSVVPTVTTNHGGIMSPADKVKLDKLQELVELKIVGTSESSVAMKPNKVYEITVGSALTITLEEPTDKTVYNEYQGTFDTGDTIPTVTFPSNVRWNDTPKVGANQHVEFSIRYSGGKYYGICQMWDITTEQSV